MARPKKFDLESIRAEARPLLGGVLIQPESILVGRAQFRERAYGPSDSTDQKRQEFAAVNTFAGQPFMLTIQGQPVTLTTTCDYYFGAGRQELMAENRRAVERAREETGRFKPLIRREK